MCESVSLVDNKNNVLNRYITYTEELNRVYGDVVLHYDNPLTNNKIL